VNLCTSFLVVITQNGASTDGVTLFFPQKVRIFLFIVLKSEDRFSHPLRLLSDRLSSGLYKFSRKKLIFIRVLPPGWCHRGRSAPPVTPLHRELNITSILVENITKLTQILMGAQSTHGAGAKTQVRWEGVARLENGLQ